MLYQRAATAYPNNPTVLNDLALCLARQGQLPAAERALARAIQLDPAKALYRNNMAKVQIELNHVDAACIYFVQDPQRYDVIVTDNLFGDILTDLGGAVSGGIGFASSGNLDPSRQAPSMFEPVHGSAPDIAGQAKANPIAAILSAAMLCRYSFACPGAADAIECAVAAVVAAGHRTADIAAAGEVAVGCREMGRLVREVL